MEDGLRVKKTAPLFEVIEVLILVLVEDGLRVYKIGSHPQSGTES